MLGNQESQGELHDKLSPHLEPDQEVAAVLGTGNGGNGESEYFTPRADEQWNITRNLLLDLIAYAYM